MKLFISADIEGTAGIVNLNETKPGDQYEYFSGQMTKEVAAACRGAVAPMLRPGIWIRRPCPGKPGFCGTGREARPV